MTFLIKDDIVYKMRNKTREELYEGWMRRDFIKTRKIPVAVTGIYFSLLLGNYYD